MLDNGIARHSYGAADFWRADFGPASGPSKMREERSSRFCLRRPRVENRANAVHDYLWCEWPYR
jgi:hypothetical protein